MWRIIPGSATPPQKKERAFLLHLKLLCVIVIFKGRVNQRTQITALHQFSYSSRTCSAMYSFSFRICHAEKQHHFFFLFFLILNSHSTTVKVSSFYFLLTSALFNQQPSFPFESLAWVTISDRTSNMTLTQPGLLW